MYNKKAQESSVGMSYGVVFSIIIIIFVIAVSIYAITYFIGLNKCTQTGLFFQSIQEEIDKAWQAPSDVSFLYQASIPSSGLLRTASKDTRICFGDITSHNSYSNDDEKIRIALNGEVAVDEKNNIFIYPPEKSCGDLFSIKLKNLAQPISKSTSFFCLPVVKGKVAIKIQKDESETLVRLEK